MEKINVAQLLKDCPEGMELYSPLCGDCKLYDITDYTIRIETPNKDTLISLYHDGRYCTDGEIMIFPKGKTTWGEFIPPCKFKDGDMVYIKTKGHNHNEFIIIFKEIRNDHIHKYVCFAYQHLSIDKRAVCHLVDAEIMRLATEEEKQKLFDAIKENGYKWNTETKTLEKLIEPKFKVGDRIKSVISSSYYTVIDIKNNNYFIKSDIEKHPYQVSFENEINYKLVPDKFDINSLKPFDKVLMRSSNAREWVATFYSHYSGNKFYGCGMCCDQCIPYEGNQHLLGTTDNSRK